MGYEGKSEKDEQVYNIEIKPRKTPDGQQVGMKVRLVVRDGDIVSITGTSTGDSIEDYVGKLILSRRRGGKGQPGPSDTFGGDTCLVCDENGRNCRWEKPCPLP
jgi:hypothetical protein